MDNEIKKFLYDIRESVYSIENYLDTHLGEQRSFFAYMENKMLRRAVEREFEIIGEAMNRINKLMPDIAVSAKHQIIGMRNRVIHGYDKIDDEIIWGTIVRHLPLLQKEIDKLLE